MARDIRFPYLNTTSPAFLAERPHMVFGKNNPFFMMPLFLTRNRVVKN